MAKREIPKVEEEAREQETVKEETKVEKQPKKRKITTAS